MDGQPLNTSSQSLASEAVLIPNVNSNISGDTQGTGVVHIMRVNNNLDGNPHAMKMTTPKMMMMNPGIKPFSGGILLF